MIFIAVWVTAHLLWLVSFAAGGLLLIVTTKRPHHIGAAPIGLDFIVSTALGLALLMLLEFALGAMHLLSAAGVGSSILVLIAGLAAAARRRCGGGRTVLRMFGSMLEPLAAPVPIAIYLVTLYVARTAVLPPAEWDSTMYHLANAIDWAHAGSLVADPFIRQPYFAYNFELIYTLPYLFHVGRTVLAVGFVPFCACALGVYFLTAALARALMQDRDVPGYASAAFGALTACSYLLSPLVLNYAVCGYVDVAIGFFFVALAVALICASADSGYALPAAIISGAFVGMKMQLILYVPMIIAVGWLALRMSAARRRTLFTACLLFAVCAAPWYLRNLAATGDPIPPILNMALHRTDPYWSAQDYASVRAALSAGGDTIFQAPAAFLAQRPFLDERGTSTSIAAVDVVPVLLIAALLRRRRLKLSRELIIFFSLAAYAVFPILYVSTHIERYALTYFAVLLIALTLLIALAARSLPARRYALAIPAALALVALLALPEPLSANAFASYESRSDVIELGVRDPAQYLATFGGGDYEASDIANIVHSSAVPGSTLAVGYENAAYYFRLYDDHAVGDWWGPGRYGDLDAAIQAGRIAEYLQRFNINSVLIGTRQLGWSPGDADKLVAELRREGFVDETIRGDVNREFVRPSVAAKAAPQILASNPRAGAAPAGKQ